MFDIIFKEIFIKTLILLFLAAIIGYFIIKNNTNSGAFNMILYLFSINILNLFIIESIPLIILGSFGIFFILRVLINYYPSKKE